MLTKDGEMVFGEDIHMEWEDCMSGEQAEALAAADPDHDWRIVMYGPMYGCAYQRHAPGEWVLVEQNEGFA